MTPARGRLIPELVLFYLAAPLVLAVAMPPRMMFPALFALTAVGVVLLHRTPGFRWRLLTQGRIPGPVVAGFAVLCFVVALAVSWVTTQGRPFAFAAAHPGLMAMILVLYPLLSALPQELVFRALWFRRYGALLPSGWPGIALNAAAFALAHLMYWSWIVAAMSFAGGLAFAWAFVRLRSFPLAVVLHAVAGQIVFLLGLGMFFYSGNVSRPF